MAVEETNLDIRRVLTHWIEGIVDPFLSLRILQVWSDGLGRQYAITQMTVPFIGAYECGYVLFPNRELLPSEELGSVRVHGSVTFAETVPDTGAMYGFDCIHGFDYADMGKHDKYWLMQECRRMAEDIQEIYDKLL